jgi:hydrogenase maturation factor HypF (carbamoyltransferase family)
VKATQSKTSRKSPALQIFLVPCSCGITFTVAEDRDRHGTNWSRYLICPRCGKKHDPKNRLLLMGFHSEGFWRVEDC